MGEVTRAEWKWAGAMAAALTAVLLLPYLLGFHAQGGEWRFSGHLFGVEDGNSYIAKMRAGAEGDWLYRLAYTTEPQRGALVFLPYLLLGKLAAGADLFTQLVSLYHLARVAAGVAMLLAAYRFLACFLESVPLRRFALLLVALGGGFGWLLSLFGVTPLEFYSPETFGFLALFGPPHLAAARALLLAALTLAVDPAAFGVPPRHAGAAIGGLLLAAWLFQPLAVPIAWAVLGAHAGLLFLYARRGREAEGREALRRTLTAAAVSAPAVLYSAAAFSLDPVLRQWTAQNIVDSPAPWEYLAGYGALLLPALAGAWRMRGKARFALPTAWMILLPFLIYFPINLQRRLADGGWTALVVLCAVFLERVPKGRAFRAAVVLTAALALPSACLFAVGTSLQLRDPIPPAFLPAAEIRAMQWLDAAAAPGAVVAGGYEAGNALPAHTALTPYLGHGPETLLFAEKRETLEAVFDGAGQDAYRLKALWATGAEYVLSGPEEQARRGARIPGCSLLYRQEGWEVWRVEDRPAGQD